MNLRALAKVLGGKVVGLDFETSGLRGNKRRDLDPTNPKDKERFDRPFQVVVQAFDNWAKDKNKDASMNQRMSPDIPMSEGASGVTGGVTDADLENEKSWVTYLPEIIDLIGDKPVVVHNGAFDIEMLIDMIDSVTNPDRDLYVSDEVRQDVKRQLSDMGVHNSEWFPPGGVIDTLALAEAVHSGAPANRRPPPYDKNDPKKGGPKKLGNIAEFYEVPTGTAHEALSDVETLMGWGPEPRTIESPEGSEEPAKVVSNFGGIAKKLIDDAIGVEGDEEDPRSPNLNGLNVAGQQWSWIYSVKPERWKNTIYKYNSRQPVQAWNWKNTIVVNSDAYEHSVSEVAAQAAMLDMLKSKEPNAITVEQETAMRRWAAGLALTAENLHYLESVMRPLSDADRRSLDADNKPSTLAAWAESIRRKYAADSATSQAKKDTLGAWIQIPQRYNEFLSQLGPLNLPTEFLASPPATAAPDATVPLLSIDISSTHRTEGDAVLAYA